MDIVKAYSRRSFYISLMVMMLLCALLDVGIFFGMELIVEKLRMARAGASSPELRSVLLESSLNQIGLLVNTVKLYYIPVSGGIFLIFGLVIWAFSKRSLATLVNGHTVPEPKKTPEKPEMSAAAKKEKEIKDKRMFLHLFSVLQREGRLMDFLSEDLEQYEDSQIGAAVRNIHDNCGKTLDKYLKTRTVVAEAEGEEITIPEGFDATAIKLTGNVAGNPPFKGVVRHQGWKTDTLDLPSLAGAGDPNIISPAEVEIL